MMRSLSFAFFMVALLIVGITVFALVARTTPISGSLEGSARSVESSPTPGPGPG
jgi:archaellum component FlaG (FlaF/FlaG flagellin family)